MHFAWASPKPQTAQIRRSDTIFGGAFVLANDLTGFTWHPTQEIPSSSLRAIPRMTIFISSWSSESKSFTPLDLLRVFESLMLSVRRISSIRFFTPQFDLGAEPFSELHRVFSSSAVRRTNGRRSASSTDAYLTQQSRIGFKPFGIFSGFIPACLSNARK